MINFSDVVVLQEEKMFINILKLYLSVEKKYCDNLWNTKFRLVEIHLYNKIPGFTYS